MSSYGYENNKMELTFPLNKLQLLQKLSSFLYFIETQKNHKTFSLIHFLSGIKYMVFGSYLSAQELDTIFRFRPDTGFETTSTGRRYDCTSQYSADR